MSITIRKSLRPYQARLIADVCRADGPVLVEQPTGSGKTMQIVTLVAMQLGQRFTHAVIAAPQQQIEHAFVKHPDYQLIAFPTCPGVAAPDIEVPEGLILGARTCRQLNSTKRLIAYLNYRGPQFDQALACTHAALNRLKPERVPDDLSGKALFLDEAHHASADGLSEIVSLWRERGGQLYFFTATPYRGDGRPVALDGMRLYRRSLAEHMAEGFAPRHLESEIVALGHRGDRVTGAQFLGEKPPPDWEEVVNAICRRWADDGRPKAIVRIPPMQGGSASRVTHLIQSLQNRRARVLDATGTRAQDKKRFLEALDEEKKRQSHADSQYDVIVGIQRVMEGTDWPVCAAVYCVGMPGSLNTVVQLLGRAMRPKGADYPQQHKDRAQLVFFVPCGGGSALADLSIDHSRHALLTCCFLADHEVGQEWIVLRQVHRGIQDALGPREQNPAAADAENEANEPLAPEVRSEVELALASAREQVISEGREPTLGGVVRQAMQSRSDLPEGAFQQVATEILAAQPEEGAKVGEAIRQEIARRLRIHPEVKKAMEEAFAVVLEEFRDATLRDSVVMDSMGRQIHRVTGGQMREFAQRLHDASPRPLTLEQILVWMDAYHARTGRWPTQSSGAIVESPGETWQAVELALHKGNRGLQGNSSLAKLRVQYRGGRNLSDLPKLTEEIILEWADAHRHRTGKWPKQSSGTIEEAPGETWSNINQLLIKGLRGLAGDRSLAQLLADHRGVRNVADLPVLSEEQILAWADSHFERTRRWPTRHSGSIGETNGETWDRINGALQKGFRGLPGNSSLVKLLAKHRGVRNKADPPALTIEQILKWADAFHERTGQWPGQDSGPIEEANGETWKAVQMALVLGARGLKKGSTLAQVLAEHRGVRNLSDLPSLTEEGILTWADAHFERTGQWPKKNSGQIIDDSSGSTWMGVDIALINGRRGLPGGSSLAKLLSERRGVRNHLNLPMLEEEQILAWADAHYKRTGHWPKRGSGPVDGVPGEKWSNVEAALNKGLRGLPGGSSLAKLLHERRGIRSHLDASTLKETQILAWADAYYQRTGNWPKATSDWLEEAPSEKWANINAALRLGLRGLPGNSSLAKLLCQHRGVRNHLDLPVFTEEKILTWVDAFHKRTAKWPGVNSGLIEDAPGESWAKVNSALVEGLRGLPGGSSLFRLIKEHRMSAELRSRE